MFSCVLHDCQLFGRTNSWLAFCFFWQRPRLPRCRDESQDDPETAMPKTVHDRMSWKNLMRYWVVETVAMLYVIMLKGNPARVFKKDSGHLRVFVLAGNKCVSVFPFCLGCPGKSQNHPKPQSNPPAKYHDMSLGCRCRCRGAATDEQGQRARSPRWQFRRHGRVRWLMLQDLSSKYCLICMLIYTHHIFCALSRLDLWHRRISKHMIWCSRHQIRGFHAPVHVLRVKHG